MNQPSPEVCRKRLAANLSYLAQVASAQVRVPVMVNE